jgi:hypothetical protein
MHDNMSVIFIPHQKKSFYHTYKWSTHSRWQFTLNPVVSSNDTTYGNVVSVPIEKYNIHMIYITTYPPSGAHAFNAAWIALHTLRECIHVLRKWPQDIPRSPHPRCTVMATRTTDTQPLLHDMDNPQANLILRGWVRDSHHPTRGNLPSYLVVCALL